MTHRTLRLARRTLIECTVLAFGLGSAVALELHRGPSLASAACVSLGLLGAAVGLFIRARLGELKMAWRCPHLDSLGLRVGSADAPWGVLESAEAALEALEPAQRRYPDFFPNARRELITAACRAVAAHRRVVCARNAPGLEGRAAEELAKLTQLLRDIRLRLLEATLTPQTDDSPLGALEALEERCGALATAVAETETQGVPAPARLGVTA